MAHSSLSKLPELRRTRDLVMRGFRTARSTGNNYRHIRESQKHIQLRGSGFSSQPATTVLLCKWNPQNGSLFHGGGGTPRTGQNTSMNHQRQVRHKDQSIPETWQLA